MKERSLRFRVREIVQGGSFVFALIRPVLPLLSVQDWLEKEGDGTTCDDGRPQGHLGPGFVVDDGDDVGGGFDDKEVELDLLGRNVIELLQGDLLLQAQFRELVENVGLDPEGVEEVAHQQPPQDLRPFGIREVLEECLFHIRRLDQEQVEEVPIFRQQEVHQLLDLFIGVLAFFHIVDAFLFQVQ